MDNGKANQCVRLVHNYEIPGTYIKTKPYETLIATGIVLGASAFGLSRCAEKIRASSQAEITPEGIFETGSYNVKLSIPQHDYILNIQQNFNAPAKQAHFSAMLSDDSNTVSSMHPENIQIFADWAPTDTIFGTTKEPMVIIDRSRKDDSGFRVVCDMNWIKTACTNKSWTDRP